ncbi:MAG: GNAT family N-acetyltransferase [Balneolaceae bacterium]|nr:GNAT family N-acetyltransferase [Balneolaceae bacterium]
MDIELRDNKDKKRFEAKVEGRVAFVDYILNSRGMIYLTHTEVPTELEGGTVGSAMVGRILEIVEERELKLVPLCPFVAAYIRRHPEWKRLLADNFSV